MKNSYMAQKYEENIKDNPLFHNTWKLLKNFRDVRWSLELSCLLYTSPSPRD